MSECIFNCYVQSLRSLKVTDLVVAVVAGSISGLLFLFLFPGKAISTLMHQVMDLPGPGAAIGFIVGPFMILCALIVWTYLKKAATVFYTCSVFGMVQAYAGPIAGPSSVLGPEVAPQMLLSAMVLGIVLDVVIFALRERSTVMAYPTAAVVSNMAFMVLYWVAVFPKVKGWVQPMPAAILTVVSVIGAIVFGSLAPVVYGVLTGKGEKGATCGTGHIRDGEEE